MADLSVRGVNKENWVFCDKRNKVAEIPRRLASGIDDFRSYLYLKE
jgi:hypothetical protein